MNKQDIWITVITYAGGILTALGFGKIIPALIEWWKENRSATTKKIEALSERLERVEGELKVVEEELQKEKSINQNTQATIKSMIPLMKSMMKDVPAHVELLDQLYNNIFGHLYSSDGKNENID
ncbi:hypothetical protein [Christiangramia sp.]|uniref:hypothetical protein n=1 Tax=Christiangramia sp. TaxID=1931228 RepID=UPI002632662B|nr:hypothetical protein [Christiangramia sp.]